MVVLGHVFWVRDLLPDFLQTSFKWHSATYKVVEEDAEGPGVGLIVPASLSLVYLWCHVPFGANGMLVKYPRGVFSLAGHAEVDETDVCDLVTNLG